MADRPRLFVELCAGLASVSLRLQGGARCRPPVSRMGNKAGYAQAVLAAMGLRSGQGAEGYLWCEPDDGCRALLQAYGQPDVLAEAAEVIRGWADDDEAPRELWERLRAEGPVKGADGREVARWVAINAATNPYGLFDRTTFEDRTFWGRDGRVDVWRAQGFKPALRALSSAPPMPPLAIGADARTVDPMEVARWVLLGAWAFRAGQPQTGFRDPWGGLSGSAKDTGQGSDGITRPGLAARLASLPALPPTVVGADARVVDPREVARWATIQRWTYANAPSTFQRGQWVNGDGQQGGHTFGANNFGTTATTARAIDALPALPPTVVGADAREVKPPGLDGVYVYIDPPYVNTTGYGADLSRAEVVAMARRWSEAGAVVAISEQEPVVGWADDLYPVDITETRKGQKRTFSKQQREYLTLNRRPVQAPAEQLCLAWAGV